MQIKLLIISLFVSAVCFGQTSNYVPGASTTQYKPEKKDSIPIISMIEFNQYLNRISLAAMKQFDLTEKAKYDAILKELLTIQAEVDKKRQITSTNK